MTSPSTFFQGLRRKARSGIFIEGIAWLIVLFVGFMLVSYFLDRTLRLEQGFRLAILILLGLTALYLVWRHLLRPLAVDLNDEELALAVERGDKDLEQALISTVQFERQLAGGAEIPESRDMMQSVVDQTRAKVDSISDKTALDRGRVLKFLGLTLVCLVVAGIWIARDTGSFSLWAKRNILLSNEEWPRYSKLRFVMELDEDGKVRQPENDELTVEVVAGGVIPEQLVLHYEFPGSGQSGAQGMDMTGDQETGEQRFLTTLPAILEPVTLYATGGDGLTKELEVILIKRPSTEGMKVKVEYPKYMGREPAEVPPSEGEVQLPIGGALIIEGRSSKRLRKDRGAFVMFGKDEKHLLTVGEDQMSFSGRWQPKASGTLTVNVEDRDGLGVARPTKLFLRLLPDRMPSVDFKTSGIGSMILHKARIPGTLKVRDDYGLTKVASVIRISGGKGDAAVDPATAKWELAKVEGLREVEASKGETTYHQNVLFDLLTLNDLDSSSPKNRVREGQMLALRFDATDNFGPGEPHMGQSEVLTFRVVSQNKLVEDLHRRQAEQRRETQSIQKRVRTARMDIADMMSPTANHPKAAEARRRLLALSRQQRNLRSRIGSVLTSYAQIVGEYENNRILQASMIRSLRSDILKPLADLYENDFPSSAKQVEEYAKTGQEDVKQAAVASYDAILSTLKRLIEKMRRLESIAAILEQLKNVRKTQSEIEKLLRKELDK